MTEPRTYALFISHGWKFDESFKDLCSVLGEIEDFRWRNHSIAEPAEDAGDIPRLRERIRQQIKPAQAVLILAPTYKARSDWVGFEITCAKQLNKPIIAVKGPEDDDLPPRLSVAADEVVAWDGDEIVAAIRKRVR